MNTLSKMVLAYWFQKVNEIYNSIRKAKCLRARLTILKLAFEQGRCEQKKVIIRFFEKLLPLCQR